MAHIIKCILPTPTQVRYASSAVARKVAATQVSAWENHRCTSHPMSSIWELRSCVAATGANNVKTATELAPIVKKILANSSNLDNKLATSLFREFGRVKDASAIPEILSKVIKPDLQTKVGAMRAYFRAGDIVKGLKIFDGLSDEDKADGGAYNVVLWAYSSTGNSSDALSLLQLMEEKKVDLNIRSFNHCMKACAKDGADDRAEEVLQSMTDISIWPDKQTYNYMIECYTTSAKWKQVQQVVDSMLLLKFRPSQKACDNALKAYAMLGDAVGARVTFEKLLQCGYIAKQETYKNLMVACAKSKEWENALLYFEVSGRKMKPDEESYTIAQNALDQGFSEGLFEERDYQDYIQTLGLSESARAQANTDVKHAEEIVEAAQNRLSMISNKKKK